MRLIAILLGLLFGASLHAGMNFVPGNYYTTTYNSGTISQWRPDGSLVGKLQLPTNLATDLRGLAFGRDGLLYVVGAILPGSPYSYSVFAIDAAGTVHKSYPISAGIGFNSSYGKVFAGSKYVYVAGANRLTRFTIGDSTSETYLFDLAGINDFKILLNGHIIVGGGETIREITTDGTIVRPFSAPGITFFDIWGLEYHAATNKLFVTMLGNFRVNRFDYSTGTLEGSYFLNYPDDLFLDERGNLLLGGGEGTNSPPVVLDQNLNLLHSIGTQPQDFITQCPSQPTVLSVVSEMSGTQVNWTDPNLRDWIVEATDDLVNGPWTPISGTLLPNATGLISFVDPTTPTPPQRFYRLAPPNSGVQAPRPKTKPRWSPIRND